MLIDAMPNRARTRDGNEEGRRSSSTSSRRGGRGQQYQQLVYPRRRHLQFHTFLPWLEPFFMVKRAKFVECVSDKCKVDLLLLLLLVVAVVVVRLA